MIEKVSQSNWSEKNALSPTAPAAFDAQWKALTEHANHTFSLGHYKKAVEEYRLALMEACNLLGQEISAATQQNMQVIPIVIVSATNSAQTLLKLKRFQDMDSEFCSIVKILVSVLENTKHDTEFRSVCAEHLPRLMVEYNEHVNEAQLQNSHYNDCFKKSREAMLKFYQSLPNQH